MTEWWREQKGDVDGNTSLHFAAALGKHQQLFHSLTVGCEINAENNFGWTPLMQAARNGETACVKLLTDFGADVAKQNRFGICALSLAAASGNLNTVCFILKAYIQRGIPLSEIEKYFSPVFFAVLFNNIDVLRYLHKYSYCLTKAVPLAGFTPVAVAKILKYKEILGFFKRRGIMAVHVQSPLLTTQLENSNLFRSTPSRCNSYSLLSPNPHIPSEIPSLKLSAPCLETPSNPHFLSPAHRSLLQVKKRKSSNFRSSPAAVTPNLSPIDFVNSSNNSKHSEKSLSIGSIHSSYHTMNSRIKLCFSSTSSNDSLYSPSDRIGYTKKYRSSSYNMAAVPKSTEMASDDDVFLSCTEETNHNNNHEFVELLRRHSLDSCISLFKKHEIDMELFLTLSKSDLEEIGVNWNKRDDVLELIYQYNKTKHAKNNHRKISFTSTPRNDSMYNNPSHSFIIAGNSMKNRSSSYNMTVEPTSNEMTSDDDMESFLTLFESDLEEIGVDWHKRDNVFEVISQCVIR